MTKDGAVEAAHRRARFDLPAGMSAIVTARHVCRSVLIGWGYTDAQWLTEAELIVVELVANAVRHAGGPPSLEIEADLSRVIVTVVDVGRKLPMTHPADLGPGRGLKIVDALAAEYGWRRRVGGKEVWVRLPAHRMARHAPTPGRPAAPAAGKSAEETGREWLENRLADVSAAQDYDAAVRSGGIHTEYRDVVDLATDEVVGHTAAPGGPSPGPLAEPAALLGAARRLNRSSELAWLCRADVVRAADRKAGSLLIVDSGPPAMNDCPDDLRAVTAGSSLLMTVSGELPDTDLGDLIRDLRRARDGGWGIDLRVGAAPASLAIMPLVRPDMITVQLAPLRAGRPSEVARIGEAVRRQAEQTGARIAAAGIASAYDRETARAMGATLGSGPLFGPPGASPSRPSRVRLRWPRGHDDTDGTTPFGLLAGYRPMTRLTKRQLLPMSIHIEHAGLDRGEPIVVLGSFQHARHFAGETRRRFAQLAGTAAFVAALGAEMPAEPAPGVHGGRLDPGDPLCCEWVVVALGPHTATALAACDRADAGPESQRRFDCAVTHDRPLVVRAAGMLLAAWAAS